MLRLAWGRTDPCMLPLPRYPNLSRTGTYPDRCYRIDVRWILTIIVPGKQFYPTRNLPLSFRQRLFDIGFDALISPLKGELVSIIDDPGKRQVIGRHFLPDFRLEPRAAHVAS